MEPSVLHSQVALFEQEDDGLFFVLGLAHAAIQLRCLLENQDVDVDLCTAVRMDKLQTQADERGNVLFFVLGLFSFSNCYLQALDGFQAGSPGKIADFQLPANRPSWLSIRDLLR